MSVVTVYMVGVPSEIDDFESAEDIVDALGAILLESHEEATQEIVDELCGHLFTTLKGYDCCHWSKINMWISIGYYY